MKTVSATPLPSLGERNGRPLAEIDPFRYGYRYRDGKMVPLTLEDALHPQEEDRISNTERHKIDDAHLGNIVRMRIERVKGGHVTCDCRVDWGIKGIPAHSPDIAGFTGCTSRPPETIGTFRIAEYEAKCFFALEIVSPSTRENDVVHKVRDYYDVGVPLYIIVDQEEEDGPREIIVYRRGKTCYRRGKLDRKGRVRIKQLGLDIGLKDNRIQCYDAVSGVRILTHQERVQGHEEALKENKRERAARKKAEAKIRKLEAELEKLRGQGK